MGKDIPLDPSAVDRGRSWKQGNNGVSLPHFPSRLPYSPHLSPHGPHLKERNNMSKKYSDSISSSVPKSHKTPFISGQITPRTERFRPLGYYDEPDSGTEHEPEKMVAAAMIELAIFDAYGCEADIARDCSNSLVERRSPETLRVAKANRESALLWLDSDDAEPMSFLWCCEFLDLDPDALRTEFAKPGFMLKERLARIKNFREPGRFNRPGVRYRPPKGESYDI